MASSLNFNLPEHERLVSCPYNKAHQVVQHRMAHHIIKCKRSHGGIGFKECSFNSSHIFPEAEIGEHEVTCPDRANLERFMLSNQHRSNIKDADSGIITAASFHVDNDEEDWDDDPPVPTYNPRLACLKSDVILDIKHRTPHQRKEMREKEHLRLTKLRGLAAEAAEKSRTSSYSSSNQFDA